MKILVTGTAGFIGYHLAKVAMQSRKREDNSDCEANFPRKKLLQRGDEVVGLDNINRLSQSVTDQSLFVPTQKLLRVCSFRHFIELIKIDDELKRVFYEVETIKGDWSTVSIMNNEYLILNEKQVA